MSRTKFIWDSETRSGQYELMPNILPEDLRIKGYRIAMIPARVSDTLRNRELLPGYVVQAALCGNDSSFPEAVVTFAKQPGRQHPQVVTAQRVISEEFSATPAYDGTDPVKVDPALAIAMIPNGVVQMLHGAAVLSGEIKQHP